MFKAYKVYVYNLHCLSSVFWDNYLLILSQTFTVIYILFYVSLKNDNKFKKDWLEHIIVPHDLNFFFYKYKKYIKWNLNP